MRIDVHHHFSLVKNAGFSPALTPTYAGVLPRESWTPSQHFEFMDRWGIEAAVLSDPSLPRLELDIDDRRDLCRAINDFNFEVIARHGDRFGTFAAVPLPDVEGAVSECRRALRELSLDGIFLGTNYFNRHLGDALFEPFYEELNRHDAVVYVHPAGMNCAPNVAYQPGEYFRPPMMEFVFDTTRTIASLVYAGVPRRYPNIRWIFSHGGGTLPFLAFRFAAFHAQDPRYNAVLPEGPHEFFRRFFYESAQTFGRGQLELLNTLVSAEQILFGTDYTPMRSLYDGDNAAKCPSIAAELPTDGDPAPAFELVFGEDRVKIERLNALRLFPRLAARLGQKSSPARNGSK